MAEIEEPNLLDESDNLPTDRASAEGEAQGLSDALGEQPMLAADPPHPHDPIRNINEMIEAQTTRGQRVADRITRLLGSWGFIATQTIILIVWVILNITAWVSHWDPYPFILMNLALSMQAAFTAPIIMMSQNRQSQKDRVVAHYNFLIDERAEEEIRVMLEHLHAQNVALGQVHHLLVKLSQENRLDS